MAAERVHPVPWVLRVGMRGAEKTRTPSRVARKSTASFKQDRLRAKGQKPRCPPWWSSWG